MALHLNLYHEIQMQQMQRARDPLKIGLYVVVCIGVILLGYYLYRLEKVRIINSRVAKLKTEWKVSEPKAKDAKAREAELKGNIKTKENLVQRIEGRFYWAPLLEKVLQTVPRSVQITSFDARFEDKSMPCILFVSGIAGGIEPRKVAEELRTAFVAALSEKYKNVTSNFSALEESDAKVQLDGKALSTAGFSLKFEFSTAESSTAPTPQQKFQKGKR